jgi:hypothetical protein
MAFSLVLSCRAGSHVARPSEHSRGHSPPRSMVLLVDRYLPRYSYSSTSFRLLRFKITLHPLSADLSFKFPLKKPNSSLRDFDHE